MQCSYRQRLTGNNVPFRVRVFVFRAAHNLAHVFKTQYGRRGRFQSTSPCFATVAEPRHDLRIILRADVLHCVFSRPQLMRERLGWWPRLCRPFLPSLVLPTLQAASIAMIGVLVDDSVVQLLLLGGLHSVMFVVLVCLKPFANR